jgi:hypothetical protein
LSAYGAPTDLHTVGAHKSTPPTGKAIFGRAIVARLLQLVIERTQAAALRASVVAFANAINKAWEAVLLVAFQTLAANHGAVAASGCTFSGASAHVLARFVVPAAELNIVLRVSAILIEAKQAALAAHAVVGAAGDEHSQR